MLMPKKRFQFNHTYLYGSAAFVVGFGAVLAALVHFAPVRVSDANIATTSDIPTLQNEKPAATQDSQTAAQQTEESQAGALMMPQPTLTEPSTPSPVPQESTPAQQPVTPDPVPVVETPVAPGDVTPVLPEVPPIDPGTENNSLIQVKLPLGIEVNLL